MILVTGAARSGTSLTTKILQAHGCYLGKPNDVNVLCENTKVRQEVLKPYIKSIGGDPQGQKPLPNPESVIPKEGLREEVLKRIGGNEPIAYKDAKLCLVFEAFAEAFPDAKWIIVRRDKERIIDSCLRTEFMFSYREREGWRQWVEHHEQRFEDMRSTLDCIEVWPDYIVQNPSLFHPVAQFCNLPFNLEATEQCIDRKKWHRAA